MWFSFDYGSVHFVSINTETDYPGAPEQDGWLINFLYHNGHFGDQLSWLQSDLEAANANRAQVPWIIVVGHRPMYTSIKPQLDDILWPNVTGALLASFEEIFRSAGVDMYIAGHVHAYERHLPVFNGRVPPSQGLNPYTNPTATVHVAPGGPGNVEGLDSKPSTWQSDPEEHFEWYGTRNFTAYGYGVLRVRNHSNLHWTYYNAADGSVMDSFELVKER